MGKFLTTNLLREEFLATAPVAEIAKVRGRGKRLYIAVAMALLVIVIALGGYVILTKFVIKEPEFVGRPDGTVTPIEPGPPDSTKPKPPVTEPKPPVSAGLKQIPWLGAVSELFRNLSRAKGELYSVATGPEGVVIFSGVVPGESIQVDSGGPLIPGANLKKVRVLSVKPVKGGVMYVAAGELIPAEKIDFDPEPVPPYNRGLVFRELDSLAVSAGLTSVETEAIGAEEVKSGNRYLIAIRAIGELAQAVDFVDRAEKTGRMLEISGFSIDGVLGRPIEEDRVKAGFVFRVYNLPPIAQGSPEHADTGVVLTETTSQ